MKLKAEDVLYAEDHPAKSYIKNRAQDALDIFSLSVEKGVFGAQVIVSRWSLGLFLADIPGIEGKGGVGFGLDYDEEVTGFGLRGGYFGPYKSGEMTILVGDYHYLTTPAKNHDNDFYHRRKGGWAHEGYPPTVYTRVGFSLGLYFGIRFEFNPGELLDFVLGFFGFDIYSDDRYRIPPKPTATKTRTSDAEKNSSEHHSIALRDKGLERFPESLCYLESATAINVDGNQIQHFPEACRHYTALQEFEAFGNRLTAIPEFLYQQKSLRLINVAANQIRELSPAIGNMHSLRTLWLGGNQLARLPEEVGKLKELVSLDLHSNQIRHLPDSLRTLKNLEWLYLGDNPIPQSEIDALQKALPKLKIKDYP